jgi:hypothetical protein
MGVEFIVVLVDTPEQAQIFNSAAGHLTTPTFKMYAIWSGQIVCGLRHGPSRPTRVVDLITNRNFPLFERWFKECIQPLNLRRASE